MNEAKRVTVQLYGGPYDGGHVEIDPRFNRVTVPRRIGSIWSDTYVGEVYELTAAGRFEYRPPTILRS